MGMDIQTAHKNVVEFFSIPCPTEDDEFVYVESLKFLIEEAHDQYAMLELGGFYYERRKFDLALKYYEMSAEFGTPEAEECLGYIWYYGRTGTKDYEKAFNYFKKCMDRGNMVATYKVADMYKNGYYVEQNKEKYKEIVENLYVKIQNKGFGYAPIPEVYTRLAKIREEENNKEEAIKLYKEAKFYLSDRIVRNPFFGNLNIMNWLICDLYNLTEPNYDNLDIFDLYYILLTPHTISFRYKRKEYEVTSKIEDNECVICFDDEWYKTPSDFISKARIKDELICTLADELYMFKCE